MALVAMNRGISQRNHLVAPKAHKIRVFSGFFRIHFIMDYNEVIMLYKDLSMGCVFFYIK